MMISVPSFVAHHKVRGAIFQCFLSFYVANLLFVLWGGLLMDEAYDIILKITADGQRRFSMRLTQEAIMELERNPYVIRSGPDRITYSREFKHHFMREYLSGKKPTEIFREAGFDPRMIGSKRIERASARWRKEYAEGTLVLEEFEFEEKDA